MTKFLTKLLFALVFVLLVSPNFLIGQSSLFQPQRIIQGDSLVFQSNGFFAGNAIVPKNGILSRSQISGGSIFKYKPNPGFEGRDTFLINMFNPQSGYVGYIVSTSNSFVDAVNDYAFSAVNTAKDIVVVSNDQSTTGTKILTKVSIGNGGTVSILNDSTVQFNPFAGFTGLARIYYTVCNEVGICSESQVFVYVSTGTGNDTTDIFQNKNKSSLVILPSNNYFVSNAPNKGGTLTSIAPNAYSYKPALNVFGIEKFTFTNSAGQIFHVRSKTFDTPNPTLFVNNDLAYTSQGNAVNINVQTNDIEKNKFVITTFTVPAGAQSIVKNGPIFTVVPKANFKGTLTFKYNAKYTGPAGNNIPANETGIVSVLVSDQRPIQEIYDINVVKNSPIVLKNKSNVLNYALNILENPSNGVANYYPGFSSVIINGQTISGYNMLIYTPTNGYVGADSLQVEHCLNGVCKNIQVRFDVEDKNSVCFNDCVWPGDMNTDGIVDFEDALVLGTYMGKIGEERPNSALEYFPQSAPNWSNNFAETVVNYKHMDANGDGFISIGDTTSITDFYLQTNNLTNETFSVFKENPLTFVEASTGPYVKGDHVKLNIVLGLDTVPAIDYNGISFTVLFSTLHVNPDSTSIIFFDSWLNHASSFFSLYKKPSLGRNDAMTTRVGNRPVSGAGVIGEINIVVETDINGFQTSDRAMSYSITNIRCSGKDGEVFALPNIVKYLPLAQEKPRLNDNLLLVTPNPTNGFVELYLNGGYSIENIQVFNSSGQLVQQVNGLNTKQHLLDLEQLPTGLYIVSIQTEAGILKQKVEVIR